MKTKADIQNDIDKNGFSVIRSGVEIWDKDRYESENPDQDSYYPYYLITDDGYAEGFHTIREAMEKIGIKYLVEGKDQHGIWSSETLGNWAVFDTEDQANQCIDDCIEEWNNDSDDYRIVEIVK